MASVKDIRLASPRSTLAMTARAEAAAAEQPCEPPMAYLVTQVRHRGGLASHQRPCGNQFGIGVHRGQRGLDRVPVHPFGLQLLAQCQGGQVAARWRDSTQADAKAVSSTRPTPAIRSNTCCATAGGTFLARSARCSSCRVCARAASLPSTIARATAYGSASPSSASASCRGSGSGSAWISPGELLATGGSTSAGGGTLTPWRASHWRASATGCPGPGVVLPN